MTGRPAPRRRLGIALLPALVALLLVAAGCGGNDNGSNSSGGSSGGGSSSANLAEAKKMVAAAYTRPTKIQQTEPVGKPIPSGKKLTWISCGIAICEFQGNLVKEGANLLGWKVEVIATDGTPEKVINAMEAALRKGTDAIMTTAADKDALAKALGDAKKKNVPVVTCCSLGAPGQSDAYTFNIGSPDQGAIIGDVLAAKTVADSGGKANALYANISAFQILAAVSDSFKKKFKELCPSCKYANLDIPLTAVGKDAPDRIVSYLRSHPDVNYLVLSEASALDPGLAAALQTAGLGPDKVKIVVQGGNEQVWQEIAQGKVLATQPPQIYSYDYSMLDALARHFAGVPIKPVKPDLWLVDKKNIPTTTAVAFPSVADYKAQWAKIWGKSAS